MALYDGEQIKQNLAADIQNLENQISHYSKAYDSLLRFKNSVCQAQTNFNTANDQRRMILKTLDSAKNHNTVAKKYQKGMGDQLTGIGMKVVDASFIGLIISIDRKLLEYNTRLQALDAGKAIKQAEYNSL